jgi:hypothetical protein
MTSPRQAPRPGVSQGRLLFFSLNFVLSRFLQQTDIVELSE